MKPTFFSSFFVTITKQVLHTRLGLFANNVNQNENTIFMEQFKTHISIFHLSGEDLEKLFYHCTIHTPTCRIYDSDV